MLLLSWNVCFQSLPGQLGNVMEAIRSVSPDVVTLQEVKTSLADDVTSRLAGIGLVHAHCSGKNPRCFDHTFVSRHLEVMDCGYYHEWRKKGWSDHSAMWTKLTFREEVPDLIEWEVE